MHIDMEAITYIWLRQKMWSK